MRLDRALWRDLRAAARSWPLRLYLVLQVAAALVFVARRGEDTLSMVVLIWGGLLVLAFAAWWAGRHRLAQPQPDPVRQPRARTLFAWLGLVGFTAMGFGVYPEVGLLLTLCGVGGWAWSAVRGGPPRDAWARLVRDPRPFVPMMLLVGIPKLVAIGPVYVLGATLALPSGIGQQLLFLIGLYAPMEAISRRPAAAAVTAALGFALVHVPLVLEPNGGDLLAAAANTVLFQASVGLIAVLAYTRHRAAVPIGVTHALAIG
jgi:hypothetical protein